MMKKIINNICIAALVIATGCSEDLLDTENLFEKSLESFYRTPADINEAMSGVYNALYVGGIHSHEGIAANLMSDMMLGGGGPDDRSAKNVDNFVDPEEDTYHDLWKETYNGVTRANAIIEKVEDTDFSAFFDIEADAVAFKKQAIGEAYFMRAFYYFRAAKFFGGVPLILAIDDPRDVPRASFSETFAQIASDFKMAIETMPSTPFSSIPTSSYGHANKWTAQAYMARAFLFYTGYMTNMEGQSTSDMPLADGGSLTKTDILGYLDDCIANSGYDLAGDFRNLWPYSYVNESANDNTVLPWAEAAGLEWVGQDGHTPTFGTGNYETMFAIRYSTTTWDAGQKYNNRLPLFLGIRDNSMVPFGTGWGWGTVNPKLWSQWDDADPRKEGSILELGNADQGTAGYEPNKGDHETGFFNKKYTTIQHQDPDPEGEDGIKGMFFFLYNMVNGDPMQLWAAQDYILMRYADVLLMHSEISETATGMNLVRERAGLGSVGYSLDALKQERLHEFAFEGLRWFDLVRWGDVDTAFDESVNVRNSGIDAVYNVTYRPETKGLVPIPESEVRLSSGVYEQNPGW
ncbi:MULTISPECIES: RagB/SusD family nutrient uptake outer membrane protein [unclassified Arenibacter]|uniref:RagB/SusD family nutrient uptake outer membrane protein n=1 Tax=unclassified Arenibacter TaxID=2615047 RepID=UPI00204344F5|nr:MULTISPECIES: RagB/SusD family nutrient uptake outer membrane protein [unclassified Arenibacter]